MTSCAETLGLLLDSREGFLTSNVSACIVVVTRMRAKQPISSDPNSCLGCPISCSMDLKNFADLVFRAWQYPDCVRAILERSDKSWWDVSTVPRDVRACFPGSSYPSFHSIHVLLSCVHGLRVIHLTDGKGWSLLALVASCGLPDFAAQILELKADPSAGGGDVRSPSCSPIFLTSAVISRLLSAIDAYDSALLPSFFFPYPPFSSRRCTWPAVGEAWNVSDC